MDAWADGSEQVPDGVTENVVMGEERIDLALLACLFVCLFVCLF